jgi:nucleoid DNA-binding protein
MAKKKAAKAANKPPNRGEVYREIAAKTGLSRKDVVAVCDNLTKVMVKSVKTYGMFNYMGLLKLTLVRKPAVAGGKLVRNPFTGEMVKQKARPASRSVRVRPLKVIKDML